MDPIGVLWAMIISESIIYNIQYNFIIYISIMNIELLKIFNVLQ